MTRVFLPLLLLAGIGTLLWVGVSWWWRVVGAVERRSQVAKAELAQAQASYDRELERARELMAERDRLLADIKLMLERDASDFPFLSKHLRQVAEDLVRNYEEKGKS